MNLALIVNQTKPEAESFQKIIEEELAKKGILPKIFLNKDFSREDFVGMDCLITLGGDGTILHTTGVLQGMPVPPGFQYPVLRLKKEFYPVLSFSSKTSLISLPSSLAKYEENFPWKI